MLPALNCQQALQKSQALGLERLDAQLLLLHALGKSADNRAWLLAHGDDVLPDAIASVYQQLSERRASGEPLAYIVGYKDFFGLRLQVDSRVLVPRPDTETLVQWALDVVQNLETSAPLQILDLGTGSGAIALAIASSLKTAGRPATIIAVDASTDALAVAQENARQLQVNVQFIESSWLEKVTGHHQIITSNPPYVADNDPHLAALAHEPLQALTSGLDGLEDLRQIIQQSPNHLKIGGWLLLEHGYDQAFQVSELLVQRGFDQVQSRLDLAGITRCTGGQWLN